MKTNTTELTAAQEKAVINTHKTLEHLEPLIEEIATIKTIRTIGQLLTVSSLVKISKLKESKAYIGMPYINEVGERSIVSNWDECCKYKLKIARSTLDKSLLNLNELGETVLEETQRIGLGDRELRKLRQLSSEKRAIVIDSEEFKIGDKESVKEKLEDLTLEYNTKLAEKQKEVDEAKQDLVVSRDISNEKQKKLDHIAEQAAKRRLNPKALSDKATGLIGAIVDAGVLITQASNQLKEIDEAIRSDFDSIEGGELDQKELEKVTRMLVSQIKESFGCFSSCTENAMSAFGSQLEKGYSLQSMILEHYAQEEQEEYENSPTFEEYVKENS